MIGISKLYCGTVEASDPLRYGRQSRELPSHLLQFSQDKKPVVVWNVTQRCNLQCRHCYARSHDHAVADHLTQEECLRVLDDLAEFATPVVLFSGGEPLMHPHILPLIAAARARGMRAVLSTNGTLITPDIAAALRQVGISYVGVSLDGLAATHDHFRGMPGAFTRALEGIRHCAQAGIKVGLRFTMNRRNVQDIDGIFSLIQQERIPRVCFYHLVYAGRGSHLMADDLTHAETRGTLDVIMDRTRALHAAGQPVEVLTVDNHCDGPYLYQRVLRETPARASEVLALLQMNGGNSSGVGIGCVSWNGDVYADQFWRHHPLGNVRARPFSAIWTDPHHPLLAQLRDRKPYLKGRCAACKWLSCCNGNFRVRSEAAHGDLWSPDPACYLTDEEIGVR